MLTKKRANNKSYTVKDYYQKYRQQIELDTQYDVSEETYASIVYDYFKYIKEQLMEHSKLVKLPCRLGTLQIIKRKPKVLRGANLKIDWIATRQEGKLIYLLNEHSNTYKYRFFWSKQHCLISNLCKWMFIASRANKRELAQIIFNKLHDYQEI